MLRKCLIDHRGLALLLATLTQSELNDGGGGGVAERRTSLRAGSLDTLYCLHALHRCAAASDLYLLQRGIGMRMCNPSFDHVFPRPAFSFACVENSIDVCCKPIVRTFPMQFHEVHKETATKKTKIKNYVTFLVEGEKVVCDVDIMTENSHMFKAMIQGDYVESSQSVISIRDAPVEAFRIICDLLHEDMTSFKDLLVRFPHSMTKSTDYKFMKSSSMKPGQNVLSMDQGNPKQSMENSTVSVPVEISTPTTDIDDVFHTCLDVLQLCDRFLLTDLQSDVTHVVFERVINQENAIQVIPL